MPPTLSDPPSEGSPTSVGGGGYLPPHSTTTSTSTSTTTGGQQPQPTAQQPPQPSYTTDADTDTYQVLPDSHLSTTANHHYHLDSPHHQSDFYSLHEKYRLPSYFTTTTTSSPTTPSNNNNNKYHPSLPAPRYQHEYAGTGGTPESAGGYSTPHYDTQYHTVPQVPLDPWLTTASSLGGGIGGGGGGHHHHDHHHLLTQVTHPGATTPLGHYHLTRDVITPEIKPTNLLTPPNGGIGYQNGGPGGGGGPCFTGSGPIQLWQFLLELLTDKKQQVGLPLQRVNTP